MARKGKKGPPTLPVDWDRVETKRRELEGHGPSRPQTRELGGSARRASNTFERRLGGFNDRLMTMMLEHGFKGVDEEGVKVAFTGVSQAPRKEIPYANPSLTKTRGGVLVVSGIVDADVVGEIGHGGSRISQVDPPDLEGYDARRRLNVTLDREPAFNFDYQEFGALIAGSKLVVSRVVTINGHGVSPYLTDLQHLWNRPPQEAFQSGYSYSRW